MILIILCFGTLFGFGAFFLLAGLLRLPTSASTKAVLTVTNRGRRRKGSLDALLFDMAAKLSEVMRIDGYKRRKLEAQLKSAGLHMTPETYLAKAWVKGGLIALLMIPALLIFPILAPVILFLVVAVFFKEQKQAEEIVQKKREEIEYELPRFVNTIVQELKSSRDVLNILKAYQRSAGEDMKRELEITIADMASGNEETALTRFESRIGSTMLSDVIRGLISVKRGDNGIVYFQMLSMTLKQLELQRLKLEAMKHQGRATSRQLVGKSESADKVGQGSGESGRTIQRYIRLTNLVPPLLQMVDDGRIAFSPAVELSHLTKEEQVELWDLIGQEDATPSLSQAIRMKRLSREAKLTPEVLYAILTEEKPNQKEQVRIKAESLRKYFPRNYSAQQMEREILKLLETRCRTRNRGER